MLDALVAEARLRWGLDLAAGLQVVAAERLIATPLEPSRPALVVPLAVLRAEGANAAGAAEPEPLPGRHGPGGRDALGVLARLYPADHAIGRFGAADGSTCFAFKPWTAEETPERAARMAESCLFLTLVYVRPIVLPLISMGNELEERSPLRKEDFLVVPRGSKISN